MNTPKPTALLELKGSFIKDPQRKRARANEPKPSAEIGNAPSYFTKEQKAIWKELKRICLPGILGNADRWSVEVVCCLMTKQRNGTIKTQEIQILISLLSKLGMTPADRVRVGVITPEKPKQQEDTWEQFLPKKAG